MSKPPEKKTEDQFIAAYDEFATPIIRHIYFRVNDWPLAKDMAQETFMKTWQYIVVGENKIENLKAFLFTTANNLIIDHYRQKSKAAIPLEESHLENLPDTSNNEKSADSVIQLELVEKYLKELPDEYRQVLIYKYINDLSIDEISKITQKTRNNVSVMIHRAVKMLKSKIKHVGRL